MSYKSLLVYLDESKSNADRVGAAMQITTSHGAHLTGASMSTLRPERIHTQDEEAVKLESYRMARRLLDEFEATAVSHGIEHACISVDGNVDESAISMAHHGRNADLIILAQPNPDSRNYNRMLKLSEEVMIHSGRPVLFMPYIGANNIPFKKALIAWDGSPAATRAVYDAIPLLKRCDDVTIMVVDSKKQKQSNSAEHAEALSKNLVRHGIHAHLTHTAPGNMTVDNVIQNEISHNNIDLLVMGGYGTPSLKQKIMGGVTRLLISSMLIPVLMAH